MIDIETTGSQGARHDGIVPVEPRLREKALIT